MLTDGRNPLPLYALRVRSNSESLASQTLLGKGYETFAPSYRVKRRWSDRIQEIDRPLFPGYVFCRFDAGRRTPVLQSAAVVEIVGVGKTAAALEDREIDAVRAIVAAGAPAQPCPFLQIGERVTIAAGPLRGAEGIVSTAGGSRKFVVSVGLLQRSISIAMEAAWLQPVN